MTAVDWLRRRAYRVFRDVNHLIQTESKSDPTHEFFDDFVARVNAMDKPKVLEIGARILSGVPRPSHFRDAKVTGFDVYPGVNVDVVGDAHELSRLVPEGHFDATFSLSVFEHLAMPWKVVLELNRVLKPGGLLYVGTHPAWPLHERPWDFYRYSADGLKALVNPVVGFEVLGTVEGMPATILPWKHGPGLDGVPDVPMPLSVQMLARKVGEVDRDRIRWDVVAGDAVATSYPKPGA